ncbi:MAG: ferritin-like domain-containing protein [Gemmatimonadota bacterium]
MPDLVSPTNSELGFLGKLSRATSRRTFLQWAGVTVGVAAIGCGKDDPTGPNPPGNDFDLGSGDVGVLNYAYALEQLEAAFYIKVIAEKYSGMTAAEETLLTDIRDHEVTHRDFLKAALGSNAISTLTFDFASVTFSSRASVLGTAKTFEDLGVSAYNGAGPLIVDANYLLLAGKIVSVEARHASAIRDLLNPGSMDFAGDDVVAVSTGLDQANMTSTVLAAAGGFINETIIASSLPTS